MSRNSTSLLSAIVAIMLLVSGPLHAETEVDAELVLAVDVSRSMSPRELEIQRRGYAEALVSEDVLKAIKGGLLGRIAIIYVEWAGTGSQRVIADWTQISNEQEAAGFAARLTTNFDSALRRTSISGALQFSSGLFEDNGFVANRQIIDISGDGPNNMGRPVLQVREETLARGIVINGLPLMTREGMGSQFHLDNLDEYYRNCVTGGPGSFVIPVLDWEHFPAAVRQKLVLELARAQTPRRAAIVPVQAAPNDFDCLIGEKIWDLIRDRMFWP